MDDDEGSGQAPVAEPSKARSKFDPLPMVVGDELAAYAMVDRSLPRDANNPRAQYESMGRVDTPLEPTGDLRKLFGPGTYRLSFFNDRHQYQGRATLTIGRTAADGPENGLSPQNPAQNPYAARRADSAYTLDDAPAWARALNERLDRIERAPQLAPAAPAPAALTVADLRSVLEVAKTLVQPMDMTLMAKFFRQGMSLAREANGAGERTSGLADVAREFVPLLGQLVAGQNAEPAANPTLAAVPPAAAPKGKPVVPAWVMPMVRELNRAIAADDDPAYTASWLERNVPPAVVTQLQGDEATVMGQLKSYGAMVPGLLTDEGETFARAVLRELRETGEATGDDAAGDEASAAGT